MLFWLISIPATVVIAFVAAFRSLFEGGGDTVLRLSRASRIRVPSCSGDDHGHSVCGPNPLPSRASPLVPSGS
jgi:hypothetical protein